MFFNFDIYIDRQIVNFKLLHIHIVHLQYINKTNQNKYSTNQQSMHYYQTELQSRRRTRSAQPQDNKEYPLQQSQSIVPLEPSPHSDIESSKIVIKQTSKPTQRKSNWSRKERIKYFVFLNYYSEIPNWGSDLKSIPTFKSLSLFIKTREPEQCKSYHLSMRRNYKSIQEMLASLREQLKQEQGFTRLVDKYQVDVIAFEMEYKLLEGYGLEEKNYFQQKLVQRSKKNTLQNNERNNPPTKQSIYYHQSSPNMKSHQQANDLEQCNFKINIKDILKDNHQELLQENVPQNKVDETNKITNNNHQTTKMSNVPVINNAYSNLPTENNYFQYNQHQQYPQKANDHFHKVQTNNPQDLQKNTNRQDQLTAERIFIQQNYNRMFEANKNIYHPYHQPYHSYQPNPYLAANHVQFPQQYRSQMPFTIPPPGGIPYMFQGYNDPYNQNPFAIQGTRFGPSLVPQNQYTLKTPQNERQSHKYQEERYRQMTENKQTLNNNLPQQGKYSQRRKKLLLQCHKHWVNWFRAISEINKRKEGSQKTLNQPNISTNN